MLCGASKAPPPTVGCVFAGGYRIRPYAFVILSERSESKDLGRIVSA